VSFAAISLCVVSQHVFIVVTVTHFVIDSIRKLLDTPSHTVRFNPYKTIRNLSVGSVH
jgi:hypothetical protein